MTAPRFDDHWYTDENGHRHEPIYRHGDLRGWHHHHTEAGYLEHDTEATGRASEDDGTVIVYTAHGSEHDSIDIGDTACTCDTPREAP